MVVCQTEKLSDADPNSASLPHKFFECLQVSENGLALGIVFVNQTEVITDQQPIDAVGIGIAFIKYLITEHPLDM